MFYSVSDVKRHKKLCERESLKEAFLQLKLCFPISLNPGSPRRQNLFSFIDFIFLALRLQREKKENCLKDWKPTAQSSSAGKNSITEEVVGVSVFWLRSVFKTGKEGTNRDDSQKIGKKENKWAFTSSSDDPSSSVKSSVMSSSEENGGWCWMGTHEDGWRKVPHAFWPCLWIMDLNSSPNNNVTRQGSRTREVEGEIEISLLRLLTMSMTRTFPCK